MSWDWEKLKQQQGKGGVPPQMDEIVDKFRKMKLPGGPLLIVAIIIVILGYSCYPGLFMHLHHKTR
jgi:membrane protease subunit HflK